MAQSTPLEQFDNNSDPRRTPPGGTFIPGWNAGHGARARTPSGGIKIAPPPGEGNDGETEAAEKLIEDVRRAQSGDAQALAGLIESNRTWVRGIAYAVLGDAHLAEDAAQDVCVRMVKHLHGLDAPEAFRPWVYRMTRNVAL